MGTDRYCSLNVHARVEQSRRDDMWSYLYMIVEMMKGNLPWRKAPSEELPFMKVSDLGFLEETKLSIVGQMHEEFTRGVSPRNEVDPKPSRRT